MTDALNTYVHRYLAPQGDDSRTLLLLHGTGGDENDLIQLGQMLAPESQLLMLTRGMLPAGQSLDKILAVIDEEIDKLRATGPEPREMTRALNQIEANFYRGMERVGGFGGKANQLNSYYMSASTPDYFQKDLDRYRALTAADIKAAVEKYLPKDRRVELSVVPGEKK